MRLVKEVKAVHRRKWLNPPSHYSTGAIEYGVDIYGNLYLNMWDCSRKIELELDTETHKATKRTIKKLAIIEGACQELAALIRERS